MVLYLGKLELLIEKWKLRRKTIEISPKPPSQSSKAPVRSECERPTAKEDAVSSVAVREAGMFVAKRDRERKQQEKLRESRANPTKGSQVKLQVQNKENSDSGSRAAPTAVDKTSIKVAMTMAVPAATSVEAPSNERRLDADRRTGKFVELRGEQAATRRRMEPIAVKVASCSSSVEPKRQHHYKESRRRNKQEQVSAASANSEPALLQRRRVLAPKTATIIGQSAGGGCSRFKVCPTLLLYASLALALSLGQMQSRQASSSGRVGASGSQSWALVAATPLATAASQTNTAPLPVSPMATTTGSQQLPNSVSSPSRLLNSMAGLGLSQQALVALAAGAIRNLWPSSFGLRRPPSASHVPIASGGNAGGGATLSTIAAGGVPANNGLRRQSPISKALERLRSRIGARNSIRVHNAFRDLAWRVLDSFSMPTPIIYELRRRNIYPIEEDLQNDSMFDKNTTLTIRTGRFFGNGKSNLALIGRRKANDNDNDDYDSNDRSERFRNRLRARFGNLLRLSRRSLFGQVVRLPILFPFKRQEEGGEEPVEDRPEKKSTAKLRDRRRLLRRRRHRLSRGAEEEPEAERQMIFINGKQFYVNDSGQLKEVEAKEKSTNS